MQGTTANVVSLRLPLPAPSLVRVECTTQSVLRTSDARARFRGRHDLFNASDPQLVIAELLKQCSIELGPDLLNRTLVCNEGDRPPLAISRSHIDR
jgi:hypothetical protein